MDDDIMIDATGITRLFEVRRQLDLWALQAAFRLSGKVSWPVTAVHPTAKLRYTNFVEMACLLFRRDKLDAFMRVYEPENRKETWQRMKARHELDEGRVHRELGRINNSPLGAVTGVLNNFPDWAYLNAKSLARRLGARGRN